MHSSSSSSPQQDDNLHKDSIVSAIKWNYANSNYADYFIIHGWWNIAVQIFILMQVLFAADRIELKRVYFVADAVEMLFYGLIWEDFMQSRWFKLKRVVGTLRLLENIGSTPDWRAEALQADRHDKMLMKFRTQREQKMIFAPSKRQQIENSQKVDGKASRKAIIIT